MDTSETQQLPSSDHSDRAALDNINNEDINNAGANNNGVNNVGVGNDGAVNNGVMNKQVKPPVIEPALTPSEQIQTPQNDWQANLLAIEALTIQPATQELSCLLKQELQLAHQLQEIMQEEFQAVETQQLEKLEKLTTHKASVLNQLQQSAEVRLQWMQQHGLPITSHCLTTAPLSECQQCIAWWQLLATTYEDNRQLSSRLADIVLTLKRRTQRKLDLLSGKPSDQVLYNQTGTTQGQQMGRGGIKV